MSTNLRVQNKCFQNQVDQEELLSVSKRTTGVDNKQIYDDTCSTDLNGTVDLQEYSRSSKIITQWNN